MSIEKKEDILINFAQGNIQRIITKPKMTSFGLNWQHCNNMVFVGVTDSFEGYYQAVRRCWRFGQKKQVNVHVISSDQEGSVVQNLKRKETDAQLMAEQLKAEVIESVKSQLLGVKKESNEYNPKVNLKIPDFLRSAA
jgi:SNF2 family DNA or RNA helicase